MFKNSQIKSLNKRTEAFIPIINVVMNSDANNVILRLLIRKHVLDIELCMDDAKKLEQRETFGKLYGMRNIMNYLLDTLELTK